MDDERRREVTTKLARGFPCLRNALGVGRFDLMEALRAWTPSHRDSFLRWAANPWWP
jgi:hypothetical protein